MFKSGKPKCAVFDIDGTIMLSDGTINSSLVDLILKLKNRFWYKIIILTARNEQYRAQTIKLLKDLNIIYDRLYMNNTLKYHSVYKKGILEKHIIPNYNILKIFDDDNSNIDVFQRLGLNAIQVNKDNGSYTDS